ncbi:hypothetical protein C9374_003110 [Naegleria lovaniensis]|uniref:Uncharacterized protein n=1 Tax=Naegleria lovaniensis TaxID=51637 RepID=A0AA88KM22_NAELO|nr:uncharacterized protein C9374_003110 [Naegleria lovaniensis]KAG2385961.1 hypothetical protein C9374_003110 [Naegleria lovaniensis]
MYIHRISHVSFYSSPPNSESVCNNSTSFRDGEEGNPISPFCFLHSSKYGDTQNLGRLRYDEVGEEDEIHHSLSNNNITPVQHLKHLRILDDSVVISTPISSLSSSEQSRTYETPLIGSISTMATTEGSIQDHSYMDERGEIAKSYPHSSFFSTLNITSTTPNSTDRLSTTFTSTPSRSYQFVQESLGLSSNSRPITSAHSMLTKSSSTSELLHQASPYRFLRSSHSSSNISVPLRLSAIPNQLIEDKLNELRKQLQGHPMISSPRYYTIPSYRSVYSHSHTEAGVDTDRMLEGFVKSCRKDIYQNAIIRDEFKKHIQRVCDEDGKIRRNAIENIKILDKSFSSSSILLTSHENAILHPRRVDSLPSFDHIQPRVSHLPKQAPTPEPVEKLFPPYKSKCLLTRRVNSRFMEWCEQKKEPNELSSSSLRSGSSPQTPKTLQGGKRKSATSETNTSLPATSSSPSILVTSPTTNNKSQEEVDVSSSPSTVKTVSTPNRQQKTPHTSLQSNRVVSPLSSEDKKKKPSQNEVLPLRISALYNLAMNTNSPSRREQIEKEKQEFLNKCIPFQSSTSKKHNNSPKRK